MQYFIIHSGKDYEDVKKLINDWTENLSRFKCSVLKGTQNDWHDDARSKIRCAEKVIYIVGPASSTNENINWELETALEENKELYVYKLDQRYPLNDILESSNKKYKTNPGDADGEIIFSQNKQKILILTAEEIQCKLKDDDDYIASHLESNISENMEIALRQYEMFVETSEELVRRKQNVNSFYITLNSLIVSAILGALTLSTSINIFGYVVPASSVVACLFTLVGGVICFSWHSVLQSYADLNSSKMKIISYIETQLAYNLYETEWQLVSNKMGNKKYKSFSKKEMFISKLFFALYILLFFSSILFGII